MASLYQIYDKCLNVWILKQYRELRKDKNFGSLKLLLKLKNAKFLKCFNYLILNCRGDLEDPLVQFLLYLTSLINPVEEEQVENTPREEGTELERQDSGNNLAENAFEFTSNTPRSVTNERVRAETRSSDREHDSVEGFVVFIGTFLASFVPILLLSYLNRLKGSRESKLAILNHYYNYVNYHYRTSTNNCNSTSHSGSNSNKDNNYSYKDNKDSNSNNEDNSYKYHKKRRSKKEVVYRSFRTPEELGLLACRSFRNVLSARISGILLDDLKVYNILFNSYSTNGMDNCTNNSNNYGDNNNKDNNCTNNYRDKCKNNNNYNNNKSVEIDCISGLEAILKKLINLRRGENFHELPDNVFGVYNAVDDAKVREQLASSLSYCARLRSNDLNQRIHANKLFKNLSKVLNSERKRLKCSKFDPRLTTVPFIRSDLSLLGILTNTLLFFNNNLIYLHKILSGSSFIVDNSCDYNKYDHKYNRYNNSYKNLKAVDREVYFCYRTLQIIENWNNSKYLSKLIDIHSNNCNNNYLESCNNPNNCNNSYLVKKELREGLEFIYGIFLKLVKFVFQLSSFNSCNSCNNLNNNNCNNNNSNNNNLNNYLNNGSLGDKYEILNLRVKGNRIYVNENLCLLIFKINFNVYKLLSNYCNNSNNYLNNSCKSYLEDKNVKMLKKMKMRINYELFPLSQWLLNCHLNLLNFKFSSICQSKLP